MPSYQTSEKGFELLLIKSEAEVARLDLEVARLSAENSRLTLQVKELSDAYSRETSR